jgi:NADP-dependent 3-hydroxy acid dehydrogenase YdfG
MPTWRKTMATNLDSHFLSAKYFLPTMRKKRWGRFVGISSNMVGLAIPGMSHYIASKMGVIGFMRVWRMMLPTTVLPQMRSCPASRIQWLSRLSRKSKDAPHGNSRQSNGLANPRMLLGRFCF